MMTLTRTTVVRNPHVHALAKANRAAGVRDKVIALRNSQPSDKLSDSAIARLVGVSRQRVHQILTGYHSKGSAALENVNADWYKAKMAKRAERKAKAVGLNSKLT